MKKTPITIAQYNSAHPEKIKKICDFLNIHIHTFLKNSESKVWHGNPVWFLDENPVVSYSVRKSGEVSLMFFSGQGFKEKVLKPEGAFKAAEIFYRDVKEIKIAHLKKWLKKAKDIQWDYKNIVKRKGVLKRM